MDKVNSAPAVWSKGIKWRTVKEGRETENNIQKFMLRRTEFSFHEFLLFCFIMDRTQKVSDLRRSSWKQLVCSPAGLRWALLGHMQDGGHGRGSVGPGHWREPREMRKGCQSLSRQREAGPDMYADPPFSPGAGRLIRAQVDEEHCMARVTRWLHGASLLPCCVRTVPTSPRDQWEERYRSLWKIE